MKLHPITSSQLGKCIRNGFVIYLVQVGYSNSKYKIITLENIHIVQELTDVFPENILGLLPKHDINFTIELIPAATPVTRSPYHMGVLELNELKMQL